LKRGLNDQEFEHVTGILKNNILPETVTTEIDASVAAVKQYKLTDKHKAETIFREALETYRPKSMERKNFLTKMMDVFNAPGVAQVEGLVERSPLITPYTPTRGHIALSSDNIKSALDEAIKDSEAAESGLVPILQRAKERFVSLLTPDVERRLEVMGLLRSSNPKPADLDKLYSIFIKDDDGLDPVLLNDAINPGALAARLWGPKIMLSSKINVQYTRKFKDEYHTKGTWFHDISEPNIQAALTKVTQHHDITPTMLPFATGFDEIYHHKLLRLANEYYNFDLNTDMGYLQFDLFMHAYDISPGEDSLDRVHPVPTPIHTYDELPILKFDGYEESDDPELHKMGEHASGGHH